jgi:hypothetical protein
MKQTFRFYGLTILTSLFLITNLENISSTNQHFILDRNPSITYTSSTAFTDLHYAKGLEKLNLILHPGTSYNKNSKSDYSSLSHCKSIVYQTLMAVPESHRNYLKHLTLYFSDGRRGLAGGSQMILRCSNINDKELISVIVHEMGHIVDTGLYTGHSYSGKSEFKDGNLPIYKDDLSLRFYRISWTNEKTLKKKSKITDFVTRYAMTDPFEDFAETYNFYLLHGEQFKEMAEYNKTLEQKYLFMKYFIFKGKEFDNDPYNEPMYFTRIYDSTLLDYDKLSFLDNSLALSGSNRLR